MESWNIGTNKMSHSDGTILGEIWEVVWREDVIRSIDIYDISIEVEDSQVFLRGHVSKDSNQSRMAEIARSVPGVTAVYNHLVADHDLTLQVAQALAADERTRLFILPVNSYHGWVSLGGEVPNRELQGAAETVAGSVPTVRGVHSLPRIAGEIAAPGLQAVQPEIGVTVYGKNGIEGNVNQVVIHPNNRLVTHAVIHTNNSAERNRVSGLYLVPVEAMDVVNAGGVVLNRNAPGVEDFPVFNPSSFPYPPSTWQPPYPYRPGNVRWPRLEDQPIEEFHRSQAGGLSPVQKEADQIITHSDQQVEDRVSQPSH